jgi:tight adherence protein C
MSPWLFLGIFGVVLVNVGAVMYGGFYLYRARHDPLRTRLAELRASGAGAHARREEDIWDTILSLTFGTVFGDSWFREKELELLRAGIRRPGAVKVYGLLTLAFTLVLTTVAYLALSGDNAYMTGLGIFGGLVLGYFLPEQALLSLRNIHRQSLMAALPDSTDLLSITLGAGLSLDQAISRVSEELQYVYPELAEEFYLMTVEVQAGQDRGIAFQHMARRTGLMEIRSLAGMIIQAERFGTGLAQSLRIFSDSLRVKRRLDIEAAIAKAAVKMIFPIVLFILPALFVVILVPGVLSFLRSLQGL